MLSVGTRAPDFKVKDHIGKTVSLADFRGKKVVLWFYPKASTPGCTVEGQAFRDEFAQFQKKNTVILGVSLDNETDNKAFADKYTFNYPLLCDTERQISLAYQAVKSKSDGFANRITYMIDENGMIGEAIEKVDVKTHAKDICSRL